MTVEPGSTRSSLPRVTTLLSALAPAVVALTVWLPVLAYYAPPEMAVAESAVVAARTSPPDAVLNEIRDFALLPIDDRTPEMEVAVAEGILDGRLDLPGIGAAPIGVPFSPDDLDELPPSLRLWFAGYVVPDFLLAAHEATGREAFFFMARNVIVAWDGYERSARLPKGYLWNDHATASRVRVLAQFWRLYRQRPDYQADVGRLVLEQAARYRALLADPGQFRFATNHGLMQNLGLMQLELAFPTLPDGPRYRDLALERIGQQLTFLMDDDGVIRENSAGYQNFGLEMLGMTFRTMTLLGTPIPAAWSDKYERGLNFRQVLQRPDGTLPATGDTDGASRAGFPRWTIVDDDGGSGPLRPGHVGRPEKGLSMHPAAGYWVEWDGLGSWPDPSGLSQTVVTWTRPPAPSHKHADELSVVVWSAGVSWLTGVGYWPFDEPGRAEAESWSGANAPHRIGEALGSERTADVLWWGWTPRLSAVDLERRGPGTYVARRQVVHLKPDLWLIVDRVAADQAAANRTVWTVSPEVVARRDGPPGSYVLEAQEAGLAARLAIAGSAGTVVEDHRGSHAPFAGWHVVQLVPRPAPAITVDQPAGDAWTLVVLSTAEPGSPLALSGEAPSVAAGATADDWTVTLPLASGEVAVARAKSTLSATQLVGTGTPMTVVLEAGPDTSAEHASIRAAFDEMAVSYPVFQQRDSARTRVTGALAGLFLAQEAFFLVVRRAWSKGVALLRALTLLAWAGLGAVVHLLLVPSWMVMSLP